MPTQAEIIQKKLKEWYKQFAKTKFAIPVSVALAALVFYASVAYLSGACLANMIAPLFLLGMLWSVGVRRVKHLLVIGAVATVVFSGILTVYLVDTLQHVPVKDALSEDGTTMVGTLDQWNGGPQTLFTYNLTITLKNDNQTLHEVNLLIFKVGQSGGKEFNYSMTLAWNSSSTVDGVTTRVFNYTYYTTLPTPINQFLFMANISDNWESAGEWNSLGKVFYVQGPVYKNTWEVTKPILPSAFQYAFIYVFGPYAIVLAMIWWTRRARRMRKDQMEKWERERAKEEGKKPKPVSKVPSLAQAMGKGEDTFVCSECGADVPADATVCPRCGEKFD